MPPPYVLGDLLGVGGMGAVYAAEHPDCSRLAVKVLNDALARDPEMQARLADEALAAQRVSHRNVVRVLDRGVATDGSPFFVMERVDGTPLGTLIRDAEPLPLARIGRIAAQVLSGLGAIHRAGLVHGDMKSDNILVDASCGDRVTIIDFGLARPPATGPSESMISGTLDYMAPELINGEPLTAAGDIYAVGIMLYEMLTGSTPFGGGTSTMVFERHLFDDVVPPSLRCQERTIPVALEGVILRALDKEPSARHHDADMFATAVERSIGACDDTSPERRVAFSTTAPTRDWSRTQPHPRRRFAKGTAPREHERLVSHRAELREAILARSRRDRRRVPRARTSADRGAPARRRSARAGGGDRVALDGGARFALAMAPPPHARRDLRRARRAGARAPRPSRGATRRRVRRARSGSHARRCCSAASTRRVRHAHIGAGCDGAVGRAMRGADGEPRSPRRAGRSCASPRPTRSGARSLHVQRRSVRRRH